MKEFNSRFLYKYLNSRFKEKLGFRTAKQKLRAPGAYTFQLFPPGKLGNLDNSNKSFPARELISAQLAIPKFIRELGRVRASFKF